MVDNKILYEKNESVYINDELFSKGKIKTDLNYTRLFCNYIQNLYEACGSANDHKQLAYLFKMIPFINRETNILCLNPWEKTKKDIRPMRLGDFCDLIGYDRRNISRLSKDLLKIKINGESALGFFVQNLDKETWVTIINPKLYFGGDKTKELFEQQYKLFKIDEGNAVK